MSGCLAQGFCLLGMRLAAIALDRSVVTQAGIARFSLCPLYTMRYVFGRGGVDHAIDH